MNKFKWLAIWLLGIILVNLGLHSVVIAQAVHLEDNSEYFSSNGSATDLVDKIHGKIPEERTDLDHVNSLTACVDLWLSWWHNYTITLTLCYLKAHINDYLQYVTYFWLTAATIFLIRNWFKIVTSQNREKEIESFKKRFIYLVIWVVLLVSFYIIIDIFVSIVNLVLE